MSEGDRREMRSRRTISVAASSERAPFSDGSATRMCCRWRCNSRWLAGFGYEDTAGDAGV
jgi:hypothetical protein